LRHGRRGQRPGMLGPCVQSLRYDEGQLEKRFEGSTPDRRCSYQPAKGGHGACKPNQSRLSVLSRRWGTEPRKRERARRRFHRRLAASLDQPRENPSSPDAIAGRSLWKICNLATIEIGNRLQSVSVYSDSCGIFLPASGHQTCFIPLRRRASRGSKDPLLSLEII